MAGDHVQTFIDKNWDVKAEGFDAAGDLLDLFSAVYTRILGSELRIVGEIYSIAKSRF